MAKTIKALACLLTMQSVVAHAGEDRASAEEVVTKVREAAALIERQGDSALTVIADPSSGFVWKDTYVFVVDCDADSVMVNPAFPERVGGDIRQHTDYAGKRYGLELCSVAASEGAGWIEYVWLAPGGRVPMRKISYVMSAPGSSYQVGAGIYDETNNLHMPKSE